ncbi:MULTISPECIES: hypothetical protein [unclassified Paraburkholderia]|uniref:hypothetical protein n=1 Tax=unclassified Paraburkholderia TaxID=2615204 RepID=UPI001619C18D|nr:MULTISPECIES: hypothetical protein [unclassified Paraburkholderia]MBB5444604.1 hypothetical protein [Paraburkholderia sp. WSM4177]MBB5485428.1 hypothetical protein [Paraburkholderia sp. WSM4180]
MKITFDQTGEFEATRAAEEWCDARGIAVGTTQRGSPRGLLVGYYRIAKWRNLNDSERRELAGTMTGDGRHGPITINLKGDANDYPLLTPEQLEHFAGSSSE